MNKNFWHTLESYFCMQGGLVQDNGHSLVPVLKNSGTPSKRTAQKEFGTMSRRRCWWNSPKADVRFSVLRLHCPEVISKIKGRGKLSIHYAADQETIETIFRIIVSENQLSLYGAVAEMCEEYESFHDRSGRLDMVVGRSILLSQIRQKFFWIMMTPHI